MTGHNETIAAIATPIGQAGIGIIRLSGPESASIAHGIFKPHCRPAVFETRRLYLGNLIDPSDGTCVDEVLVAFMNAPHSYTCEDVVEINSHSGHMLLTRILKIVLEQGARLALPGEFTMRAFLNGRIDLPQAEAVVDLINARSEKGVKLAAEQVMGFLGKKLKSLRKKAMDILAQVEVAIDFPEEDTEILSREEASELLEREIIRGVKALITDHRRSRIWIEGVRVVIAGKVNAGKSSLLNRMVREDRAIVTPMPGTTRDIIEVSVTVEGIPLRLMDTAGFGKAHNEAERIGIRRSEEMLEGSELLLILLDQSRPLEQEDIDLIERCRRKNALVIFNKTDLKPAFDPDENRALFSEFTSVRISALTGSGMEDLYQRIKEKVLGSAIDSTLQGTAVNLRHSEALDQSMQFFKNAASGFSQGAPMEIIALDLKGGIDAIDEITGPGADQELLDSIFSCFCLGK